MRIVWLRIVRLKMCNFVSTYMTHLQGITKKNMKFLEGEGENSAVAHVNSHI